jgi:hypothetical protein
MELGDTARIRHPSDPVEHRLATVIDRFTRGSAFIHRYELRFPNGETRMYRYDAVIECTRDDDRAAIIAAYTAACRSLRDACRRAHDHDPALSADTASLLASLITTAQTRLDINLELHTLGAPADPEQVTP